MLGNSPCKSKYETSMKSACFANSSIVYPLCNKVPLSPSIKVIFDTQLPVDKNPGSNVKYPVSL